MNATQKAFEHLHGVRRALGDAKTQLALARWHTPSWDTGRVVIALQAAIVELEKLNDEWAKRFLEPVPQCEPPTSRGTVSGKRVCAPRPSSEPYKGE